MWFCGNKLIPNNICQLLTKNTSALHFIPAIVFSLLSVGLSFTDVYRSCRHVLIEIVCVLCSLNSVLSVFNYLQVQCSLLYVYFYNLLFCSIPSFVPHSVCKPWKEVTWFKFSTSSSNSCTCFFISLHCIALQSVHSTQRSVGSDNHITTTNIQACGLVDTNQSGRGSWSRPWVLLSSPCVVFFLWLK